MGTRTLSGPVWVCILRTGGPYVCERTHRSLFSDVKRSFAPCKGATKCVHSEWGEILASLHSGTWKVQMFRYAKTTSKACNSENGGIAWSQWNFCQNEMGSSLRARYKQRNQLTGVFFTIPSATSACASHQFTLRRANPDCFVKPKLLRAKELRGFLPMLSYGFSFASAKTLCATSASVQCYVFFTGQWVRTEQGSLTYGSSTK